MVTIYDIAKKTGFSSSTVSRALTGTGTLNENTRQKIIQVANEMGYEPNITARTLSTKKSNLIGVIYDDTGMNRGFAHPLFSEILTYFREQIECAGYDLVFLSRHSKLSYFAHASYRSVDGVIIINPASGDPSDFSGFVERGMPCVSTNCILEGIPTILTDNEKGGYEATDYLIKKGHKKIALLSAPRNRISSAPNERLQGFKKALSDNGLEFDEELFVESELWDKRGAYAAFEKLYKKRQDFTAVMCSTDWLAFGVYEYAEKHGLNIPEDFSIIGFDDDYASSYIFPNLTTFHQDAERIADLACEVMMNQLAGFPSPTILRCEAKFIERQSVKNLL